MQTNQNHDKSPKLCAEYKLLAGTAQSVDKNECINHNGITLFQTYIALNKFYSWWIWQLILQI